jgi:hypothetical protein
MGTLGLIAFAILIWRFLPSHSSPAILTIAGLAWLAISVLAWRPGQLPIGQTAKARSGYRVQSLC